MIPLPHDIRLREDSFLLAQSLVVQAPNNKEVPHHVLNHFTQFYLELSHKLSPSQDTLLLKLNLMQRIPASHKDMYLISIEPGEISLSAKSINGFRYALSTLKQLLYHAANRQDGRLNCGLIADYPSLDYRGLHLDESRHFFGKDTVLRLLQYMADLKLNYFHWHLSDDQGWRIESSINPRLAEVAAWRREQDGSLYGGCYSKADVREIVSFATTLGINIIPEFDFPGHSLALLAAYPELACRCGNYQTANTWGIFKDILCVGRDSTLCFLKNLISEYAELFPGDYFHIGGDEVLKDSWENCTHCRTRLQEQNLPNFEALQGWFTDQLVGYLRDIGKQTIAWDEVLDSSVDSSVIAMLWRGDAKDSALLAKANGNRYILCPNRICYLDWKAEEGKPGAHGISTLENVYGLDYRQYPAAELCLGLQANVWTEHMHIPQELYSMLHPRAVALAERAWNPKADFADFCSRLQLMEDYFVTLS